MTEHTQPAVLAAMDEMIREALAAGKRPERFVLGAYEFTEFRRALVALGEVDFRKSVMGPLTYKSVQIFSAPGQGITLESVS